MSYNDYKNIFKLFKNNFFCKNVWVFFMEMHILVLLVFSIPFHTHIL